MAITRGTVHVSNAIEKLYADMILSTPTLNNGWVQVLQAHQKQATLNRFFTTGDNLGVVQPKPSTTVDASTKDERQVLLVDMQYYDEFDPREFNLDWDFLWSQGPSAMQTPSAELLAAITPSVSENVGNTLEKFIWQGDATTGIEGYLPLIDLDATVIDTTSQGAAITAANILSILAAMKADVYANNPAIIEKGSPTFFMSHQDKNFYEEATLGVDFKGADFNEAYTPRYQGIPIVSTHGIPAGRIVLTTAGAGDMSNLKYATWMDSDRTNVEIARTGPLDDTFGVKVTLTAGVNHVYGKEIVNYLAA
jgi:hypothetical protein